MNKADLVSGLRNLLHHKELQGASCSLVVKDAKSNTLLSYNPGLFLVPASVMKLVATATALHILGPAYRFKTRLAYTGDVTAGKLNGNLLVKGYGDPTLGSHYFDETSPLLCFEKILQALKARSVEEIEGDIIVDNTYLGDPLSYQDWTLEDYPWYYGAIPQAFNFIDNSFPVRQSGSNIIIGDMPGISKHLLQEEFEVFEKAGINEIKAIGCPACDKKSLYIDPALAASAYRDEKLSLSSPAKIFKESLKTFLQAKGIKVNAKHMSNGAEGGDLGTLLSPPLLDIVKYTHYDSINLFAECIYLVTQKFFEEKNSNFNVYWKGILGSSDFSAVDGSGLARKDNMTASFLAELLVYMLRDTAKTGDFSKTLPLLGEEGAVKNYCRSIAAKNKVRLKTGSMGKVRAFAGVVEGAEPLVFSMIFNNYQCSEGEMRALCDRMLKEFAMA